MKNLSKPGFIALNRIVKLALKKASEAFLINQKDECSIPPFYPPMIYILLRLMPGLTSPEGG